MRSFIPAIAALIAFLIVWLFGQPVINMLKRLKFGQTIREEGPDWHKSKQGTPTMGGILFAIGTIFAVIVAFSFNGVLGGELKFEFANKLGFTKLVAGLGLAVGMGLIGFFDDYIKVVKKRNLGLTAMQKTIFQSGVCAAYLCALALAGLKTTNIPFIGDVNISSGIGLIFWPIAFFFIYGFTNAVNLTDGIDGLASSVTTVVAIAFMFIAGALGFEGANIISASLAGALVGFLVWNWHPAKVFMGDTGSMFLGGMVVALSFMVDRPVFLILIGIIYLVEALSVVLQVAYFKKTKKRLFKMSPIHHHFEKSGWNEEKIVFVFSFITVIFSVLCVLAVKLI